jgi:hypothetical protein
MTATEGPAKGLELPDREELKVLEGLELEKSAMVGGSEAAVVPKGGGAARVFWEPATAPRRGGRLGWARVRICI